MGSTLKCQVVHTCRCDQLSRGGDTDGRTGDIGSSTRDAGDPRSERRSVLHLGEMQPLYLMNPRAPAVPDSLSSCLLYHPSTF
jgi:hypothetical protein